MGRCCIWSTACIVDAVLDQRCILLTPQNFISHHKNLAKLFCFCKWRAVEKEKADCHKPMCRFLSYCATSRWGCTEEFHDYSSIYVFCCRWIKLRRRCSSTKTCGSRCPKCFKLLRARMQKLFFFSFRRYDRELRCEVCFNSPLVKVFFVFNNWENVTVNQSLFFQLIKRCQSTENFDQD